MKNFIYVIGTIFFISLIIGCTEVPISASEGSSVTIDGEEFNIYKVSGSGISDLYVMKSKNGTSTTYGKYDPSTKTTKYQSTILLSDTIEEGLVTPDSDTLEV